MEKTANELLIANKELFFQNEEKEKRAAELIIANKELVFQNTEKEKRAAELIIANKELIFQNAEKEKRAAELSIANKELLFQNSEKEKRAAELIVANKELEFQNTEKEKRASELSIANKELVFQNAEKEKRAAELIIANKELEFQNKEKEKRASELAIANAELAFQQEEKEKRAEELIIANKELESFSYSVSHDLRAPIRAISAYAKILEEDYLGKLDAEGAKTLLSIIRNSKKMGQLIDDLLAFSKLGRKEVTVSEINMDKLMIAVKDELIAESETHKNIIEFKINAIPPAKGDIALIKQVLINLISNAIKYSGNKTTAYIEIGAYAEKNLNVYYIKDNGVGFDMQFYENLFGVFHRLHTAEEFEGTGIGLAIVHKIIERHGGKAWAESTINEGATFYFSLPSIHTDLTTIHL
jgi:signal transduction histidine kinase